MQDAKLPTKIKSILLNGGQQSYSSVVMDGEFVRYAICGDRDKKLYELFLSELSTYKQELIELRVRIAGIDNTKLSKGWVVEQLDDLINHIKGEK